MPAVSKKQERFMQAVAHSPKFAKKVGVPQSVGREFTKKEGGEMKESKSMMKKEVAFMKKKGAPKSMIKHEMKEAGMKSGGKAYAGGGNIDPLAAQRSLATKGAQAPNIGPQSRLKPIGSNPRVAVDPKPTPVARGRGPIKPLPTPPSRMMKDGGKAYAKGGGIEVKGKTKGKMVKMAGGGRGC